jgi:voltage-gated potassium channel Kch
MFRDLPSTPALLLVRAAHPRQAAATALALAAAAAVAGRPLREVTAVFLDTVAGRSLLAAGAEPREAVA